MWVARRVLALMCSTTTSHVKTEEASVWLEWHEYDERTVLSITGLVVEDLSC